MNLVRSPAGIAMGSTRNPLGSKASTQSALRAAVFKAARLLERRLDAPPSVAELAKVAGVSVFHFHRAFRSVVGETVAQHSLRLRLERAATFLKFSSWQVQEIALASGFGTQASFTRAFSRLYGMAPETFRRNAAVMPFLRSRMRSRPALDLTPPAFPLPTVRIEEWPTLEVVCLRSYSPMTELDQPWSEVLAWARVHLGSLEQARFFGLWYDEWREGEQPTYRYDCAIAPSPPLPVSPPEPFLRRTLPPGPVAMVTTRGRLGELEQAWRAFAYGWLPLSGYQPRGRYVIDEYPARLMLTSELSQIVAGEQHWDLQMCLPVQQKPLDL